MKVLFLTNVPAPYRVNFFNELGKFCDLTVAFEGNASTDRKQAWHSEKAQTFTQVDLNGLQFKSGLFLSPRVFKLFQSKWDAIIIGGYSTPTGMLAIEYLRCKKIPFYLEVDGGLVRADNKLKFWIKKHFISAASKYFSSGKETTKYLVHYGADPSKIYEYPFTSLQEKDILPQVLCEEDKQALRQHVGIVENKVIVSVGQFIPRKGYDVLLHAAARLPREIGIYIIGDQPTEEYLAMQKKYHLRQVHFVGFQSKEELKKWYQAADVFVLPTREDIWGLVINEAMAQGLPIITTERCVAGVELVKKGENGYLVPVDDVPALARAITQVFAQDYRIMGQKSLELIRPYTIEQMAQQHVSVLKGAQSEL